MIRLQQGIFSPKDAYFKSIEATFLSCCTHDADFRELTPEFYSLQGDLYINVEGMDLGLDELVGDVELPLWAREPSHFCELMREALESDYVSEHINEWIDLIFGYKQTGSHAETAYNQFPESCYHGTIPWADLKTEEERSAFKVLVRDFGQNPHQLYTDPHPIREFRWSACLGPVLTDRDEVLQLRLRIEQLHGQAQTLAEESHRELMDLMEEEREDVESLKAGQQAEVRAIREKIAVLEAKKVGKDAPIQPGLRRNASLGVPKSIETARKLPPRGLAKTTRNVDLQGIAYRSGTINLLQKRLKPSNTESSVPIMQTPLSTSRRAPRRTKSITPPKLRPVTAFAQYNV